VPEKKSAKQIAEIIPGHVTPGILNSNTHRVFRQQQQRRKRGDPKGDLLEAGGSIVTYCPEPGFLVRSASIGDAFCE